MPLVYADLPAPNVAGSNNDGNLHLVTLHVADNAG